MHKGDPPANSSKCAELMFTVHSSHLLLMLTPGHPVTPAHPCSSVAICGHHCSPLLITADQTHEHQDRPLLITAHPCSSLLTTAHPCSSLLTRAHLWSSLLTPAYHWHNTTRHDRTRHPSPVVSLAMIEHSGGWPTSVTDDDDDDDYLDLIGNVSIVFFCSGALRTMSSPSG